MCSIKFYDFHAVIYDIQPDIVGITETWANGGMLDAELCLQRYHMFGCNRNTGSKGRGILLYINESSRPVKFHTKLAECPLLDP